MVKITELSYRCSTTASFKVTYVVIITNIIYKKLFLVRDGKEYL
jgi:hypothetical protein